MRGAQRTSIHSSPGFKDLLSQLAEAHTREVSRVREECAREVDRCRREIQSLRHRLERVGISPEDVTLTSKYPQRDAGAESRPGGAALQDAWGEAVHIPEHATTGMRRSSKVADLFESNGEHDGSAVPGEDTATSSRNSFEIKSVWEHVMESPTWGSNLDSFLVRCGANGEKSAMAGGAEMDAGSRHGFVIYPNSIFRMHWDFVGLVLICYDLITIPFNQAFQPDPGWFSSSMDWLTLFFWTGDMIQGFFLGYYERGVLVVSNFLILKRYLCTWFLVDLIVVGPEWLMMFFSRGNEPGTAGAGKMLKSIRAVRVLRLLRLAKVVFSSIVGSISGSMTSLRSMKSDQMKQFWLLRRYLRQRHVSKDLSSRIHKYLEHQYSQQNNHVQLRQIKVLDGLSESLQNELTHQMHSPHLLKHPFFDYLNAEMEVVMHRLCRLALHQQSYAEREVVFGAGDEATKVFFVKSGSLDYTMMDGMTLQPPPQPREWIGEALLWTVWRHQGDLLAMIESELISIDPNQFVAVMSVHPKPWFYAKRYADKFLEYLNSISRTELLDILRHDSFYATAVSEIRPYHRQSLAGHGSESPGALRGAGRCAEEARGLPQQGRGCSPEAGARSCEAPAPRAAPWPAAWQRLGGFCPCPALCPPAPGSSPGAGARQK